jgi:hypothetical protein
MMDEARIRHLIEREVAPLIERIRELELAVEQLEITCTQKEGTPS